MSDELSIVSIPRGEYIVNQKILDNPSIFYKPITISWLETNTYPKITENDKGIFELIQNKFPNSRVVIGLLDLSIPQYIANKYHSMNIERIGNTDDDKDEKYAAYTSWYAQYCHSLGLEYLHDIQIANTSGMIVYIEQNNTNVNLNTRVVRSDVLRFALINCIVVENVGKITKLDNTPPDEECIKRSITFLTAPCILIQIPWNTTVFHQWLLLAMLDVLTFEKYTLELRYWPIPIGIVAVVTELLLQLRILKERIMLGFLILCQQIQMFPTVIDNSAEIIMNHVILPSLSMLTFIQPGKNGHKILQSIKLMIWSSKSKSVSKKKLDTFTYISNDVYNVNNELETCFQNTCYGLKYWFETIPMGFYYPKYEPVNVKVERVISEIGEMSKDQMETCSNRKVVFEQIEMSGDCEADIQMLLATIERELVKKGRISEKKYKKLKTSIKSYDKGVIISMICCALILNKCKSFLCESEHETGLLRRIVILQLEILEREELLKLTNTVCLALKITPIDINTKKYVINQLNMTEMNDILQKNKSYMVETLWEQFDKEWLKPIDLNEPELEIINKSDFLKECSNRLGRIVVNIARKQLEIYEKGGVIYPHWLTVQYVLPCYVSILINRYIACQYEVNEQNTLSLVHGLLQYYEQSAVEWSINIVTRKPVNVRYSMEKLMESIANNACKLNSYMRHIHLMISGHLTPEYTDTRQYFYTIKMSLADWFAMEDPTDRAYPGYKYLNIWLINAVNITSELDEICMKSWNYPNETHLVKLGCVELYELDELMTFFVHLAQVLLGMILPYFRHTPDTAELKYIKIKRNAAVKLYYNDLYDWRFNFISATLSPKNNERPTMYYILKVRKQGLKIIRNIYSKLKEMREYFPDTDISDNRFWDTLTPKQLELQNLYLKNAMDSLEHLLFGFIKNQDEFLNFTNGSPVLIVRKLHQVENATVCRSCKKIEKVRGDFVACKICIADNYPDINYFCTGKCEASWWKIEHMAEHIEFELGLSLYNN